MSEGATTQVVDDPAALVPQPKGSRRRLKDVLRYDTIVFPCLGDLGFKKKKKEGLELGVRFFGCTFPLIIYRRQCVPEEES